MVDSDLPPRPSLVYLKKLAKERLRELRLVHPPAKLADAQRAVASDHGFPSWRALKAAVERRTASPLTAFIAACARGDVSALAALLDDDPGLVRERTADGTTGLHLAVRHAEAVRLLLERGADPNVRDIGDNALALHFAAGGGHLESARALLDAGSDVHGAGDVHRVEIIGWATVFGAVDPDVVALLVERGARHHVFSAIALGDIELLRRVVSEDHGALGRRLSRFEQEQTALHYVIAPPDGLVGGLFRTGEHYRTLDALIELEADLEACDAKGRTPLALAMLRGDREAMRRLHAAGAKVPETKTSTKAASVGSLAKSVDKLTPMLGVADMDATVAWYTSIGFAIDGNHGENGKLDWASLSFGDATVMFSPSSDAWRDATTGLSLWLRTTRLDDIYGRLKAMQLERAQAALAPGVAEQPSVRFTLDLHTAFYGQREFCIRDPNGVELCFFQPLE